MLDLEMIDVVFPIKLGCVSHYGLFLLYIYIYIWFGISGFSLISIYTSNRILNMNLIEDYDCHSKSQCKTWFVENRVIGNQT